MAFGKKGKADVAERDAVAAWEEGRRYFVLQTRNTFSGQTEGSMRGVAEALEAAVAAGWEYVGSSYAFDQRTLNSLVGVHTFRRPF